MFFKSLCTCQQPCHDIFLFSIMLVPIVLASQRGWSQKPVGEKKALFISTLMAGAQRPGGWNTQPAEAISNCGSHPCNVIHAMSSDCGSIHATSSSSVLVVRYLS
jgi:hypothetical protein